MPDLPDFTDGSWQKRRSDAKLLESVLDGKGADMPPWRKKLSKDEARDLVEHVRAFGPTPKKQEKKKSKVPEPVSFEERFHRLSEELEELERQSRELAKAPPAALPGSEASSVGFLGSLQGQGPLLAASVLFRSRVSPGTTPSRPAKSPQRVTLGPSPRNAAGKGPARELYLQHCAKCHGKDGTGSGARGAMPDLPDLTDRSWQKRRSEAQLLGSILDGKGKDMPPWREKISEEEARDLVSYVRTFAPGKDKTGQKQQKAISTEDGKSGKVKKKDKSEQTQEQPTSTAPPEPEPSGSSSPALIGWLGRFHPAAVHFPIALLTAAAVAELLLLATGKPTFDAASRYCVWFGTLTAVAAGLLGWFLGDFRLSDASWVMTTHRWLGTASVLCAVLVLILSELSRRPVGNRSSGGSRVALLIVAVLVLVTGFFGGAVVFGLDHYAWPQ
jgi:mono/diheme cytochrome c family protein/uncharacterized membrane protein